MVGEGFEAVIFVGRVAANLLGTGHNDSILRLLFGA
jgi:hypothetical protein